MSLTDIKIRASKPSQKPYKIADEKGLFLLVMPNGSKYWRMKYRFAGKEKTLALGVYPTTTLSEARDHRDQARKVLANDTDPGLLKKVSKHTLKTNAENSFQAIALEWYTKYSTKWANTHSDKLIGRFEKDVFPWMGSRPIAEITAPELLAMLRRVEGRGAIETAHRIRQACGQVFRYAIATGRAERDPSQDLKGALQPVKTKHYSTLLDPKEIGKLLLTIDSYEGYFITKCALRLTPLLFVRPGELRHAEWSEFDFEKAEWRISAAKMKMRATHIVPLSTQAIEILRELQALTGKGKYVFPGIGGPKRAMSENTVTGALRRLGYTKEEMTGHGFRSMASTLLNEQGWNRDAIERQLAHSERDAVRAAYNHAEHLPERRKMMQHWADYLTSLKTAAAT